MNRSIRCLYRPPPSSRIYCSLRRSLQLPLAHRCYVSVRPKTPAERTADIQDPPKQKNTVFLPKTRIVVGIVFVGALIWSMVTEKPPSASPETAQTEAPSVADLDARRKRESGVTDHSPMRLRMEAFIKEQQDAIVRELEALEARSGNPDPTFRRDAWTRPAGGDGISCVLQDGQVFDKAGVNTSVVYGTLPRAAIQKMRVNHKALADPDIVSLEFFAAGLSLVLHPINPFAPTVHLNYRYFETMDPSGDGRAWWFGGGTDLTPSYLFDNDAVHFHATIKAACDRHGREYYPRFKAWCDRYFRLPHRNEARGVGGIFFDDLDDATSDAESLFAFVQDCLRAFPASYLPILERRKDTPYTPAEKAWQQLRRGRYVEFNLVHDRGTSFGLNTPGARVESILMSLPLTARWQYMYEPAAGSREERLVSVLKEPKEWV